jgi:adenylate kinase family enzyme
VAIIGTSGSGKSTLGVSLADRLGVPYVELDSIFHQPHWTPLPAPEFERRVEEVAALPSWVIDGSYSAVRHLIWPRAECIVWLDLPRLLVTYRVLRRTVVRCAIREELWNGNRERWRDLLSSDPGKSPVAAAWKRYPEQRDRYATATKNPRWHALSFVHLRSPHEVKIFLRDLDNDESLDQPRS